MNFDTSRAVRKNSDRAALAMALFQADTSYQESDWLEWKSWLDLEGRSPKSNAVIAQAVLSFANRDPDAARREMQGCAYLLAGIKPGECQGVGVIDIADLEQKVGRYIGDEVLWSANYVKLSGNDVLVVTVEPPEWGQAPFHTRKTFRDGSTKMGFDEGTIFVRTQGKSRPAKASDLDRLFRRLIRRQLDAFEIEVGIADETRLQRLSMETPGLEAYVDEKRDSLLAPLVSASVLERKGLIGASYAQTLSGMVREARSEEDFVTEVDAYRVDLLEALPSCIEARFIAHRCAVLCVEVVNRSDDHWSAVELELRLPDSVAVFTDPFELTEEAELPEEPVPFGARGMRSLLRMDLSPIKPMRLAPLLQKVEIEARDGGFVARFDAVEVRAQSRIILPRLFPLIPAEEAESLVVSWTATAANKRGRDAGTLTVPIEAEPVNGVDLLAVALPDEDPI